MGRKLIILTLSLLILSGCFPKPNILEDVQIVQAIAYDYVNDQKIRVGAEVSVTPTAEQQAKLESELFIAESHTNKSARRMIESESPKPFRIGRLGVALYDKTLAEQGLRKMVDKFQRDPSIGRDIFMAVVEGSPVGLLEDEYTVAETPSKYLIDMLDQNMRSNIPRSSLHHYLYRFYGMGMDPFMPLLEKKGKHIEIKGVALFKDDKYKGYINIRQAFLLKMLREKFKTGMFEVRLKKDKYFTVENISSQVDYKIKDANNNPKITMDVKMSGGINEAPKIPIGSKKMILQMETATQRSMEKEMNAIVKKFQRLNVDPIALGDRARSKTRKFDYKNWQEKYPKIPIKVNVKVNITQLGIMD
jgi:spore germination protein